MCPCGLSLVTSYLQQRRHQLWIWSQPLLTVGRTRVTTLATTQLPASNAPDHTSPVARPRARTATGPALRAHALCTPKKANRALFSTADQARRVRAYCKHAHQAVSCTTASLMRHMGPHTTKLPAPAGHRSMGDWRAARAGRWRSRAPMRRARLAVPICRRLKKPATQCLLPSQLQSPVASPSRVVGRDWRQQ